MEAIFLDRDGVINQKPPDGTYVASVNELHFLPGAIDAVARLSQSGYSIFIVTNQRGIARGLMTQRDLDEIHLLLHRAVLRCGGRIQKIYVCTHDHQEKCQCRKPNPGMLLQAQLEYGVDLKSSWMIGDSPSDLSAGRQAGCRTAIVNNGAFVAAEAEVVGASLSEVAHMILQLRSRPSPVQVARDLLSGAIH